jgi:hypothetical protein
MLMDAKACFSVLQGAPPCFLPFVVSLKRIALNGIGHIAAHDGSSRLLTHTGIHSAGFEATHPSP